MAAGDAPVDPAGGEAMAWSDLDTALFLLDGACQSIVDEWHGKPDPHALRLLAKHSTRIEYLRREYAIAWRGEPRQEPATRSDAS